MEKVKENKNYNVLYMYYQSIISDLSTVCVAVIWEFLYLVFLFLLARPKRGDFAINIYIDSQGEKTALFTSHFTAQHIYCADQTSQRKNFPFIYCDTLTFFLHLTIHSVIYIEKIEKQKLMLNPKEIQITYYILIFAFDQVCYLLPSWHLIVSIQVQSLECIQHVHTECMPEAKNLNGKNVYAIVNKYTPN